MVINDEKDQVWETRLSVQDIRSFFDTGDQIEEIDNLLDEAQGWATINNKKCFVVIEVSP